MAKIQVAKPFTLNVGGEHRSFAAGAHEVADDIAAHWYVQAHCEAAKDDGEGDSKIKPGRKPKE